MQPVDFSPCLRIAGILEELLSKENKVLEYWTQRKKRLDQCHQYVLFERSAKQTLEWIREKAEVYLATHANSGKNRLETEQRLHEHNEFKGEAKVIDFKSSFYEPQFFSKIVNQSTFKRFWYLLQEKYY